MAGLRTQVESDLAFILEDAAGGFGWPITLTDPSGTEYALTGFAGDVAAVIDPDTGQAVTGRNAHVTLRMSSLPAGAQPKHIAEATAKPWLVTFDSVNGVTVVFKVIQSSPDHTVGMLTLRLEVYQP